MSAQSLKVIDIFSGVGGLSLGAARAGFDIALAIENDPFALKAHATNFPSANHVGCDVSQLSMKALRELVRLSSGELAGLVGGPPCQGFSSMGHRHSNDPRNQLFVRFFSFVRELQPRFFLAENVPGIMSAENEELRTQALSLVENDYNLLPPIKVNAMDFGAPTTRTRFLFIGYKAEYFNTLRQEDFHRDTRSLCVRDALAGLPVRIAANWNNEAASWRAVDYHKMDPDLMNAMRNCVPRGVGNVDAIRRLREHDEVSGFLGTKHTSLVLSRLSKLRPGEVDRTSKSLRLKWDGVCPTLRAGTGPERGSYQAVRPIHPTANRVITPREAARLQSFPDWFQFSPTKWHSFRQIGNSVCPVVAEAAFATLLRKMRK